MRNFFIRLFVNALALSAAAWMVPGIALEGGLGTALFVAFVFGVVNALIKPVLLLLSLPLLLITLGLFTLFINAALLGLTAVLVDALRVSGFGSALLGSLVISFVSVLLGGLLDDEAKDRRKNR
jgi:putative membrane protein